LQYYRQQALTLWRPVVPHGYSYEASYARPG